MGDIKIWIMEKVWRRMRRTSRLLCLLTLYVFDRLIDACIGYINVMHRELELFFGSALLLIGLLNFNSSKYCDGNTSDYLSCTRPATYYYFDWLDITLVLVGVFFIMLWYLERKPDKKY